MVSVQLFVEKFRARAGSAGFFPAVGYTMRQAIKHGIEKLNLASDEFDVRYGTDTAGLISLCKYGIDSPNAKHGGHYVSTSEKHIEVLLAPLPRNACFVDVGCGKGRPLLVAAQMGFKTVIGVEFVSELAEIADSNLRKMDLSATVIHADAASYEFPAGPLIVYLYNPFDAVVMSRVAQNLRSHAGDLWVLYVNPRHDQLFESWMQRMPLIPSQAKLFSADSVSLWHKPEVPSSYSAQLQ